MGLGGFFNYEKPGRGIRKDEPKKKLFFVFLETWVRNFWELIPVNFVYSLLTVLLIPCGLASAGITNVCRNLARDKHSFMLSDFFATVKKNWKQALPAGIINLIVNVLTGYAIYFYFFGTDFISVFGLAVALLIFVIFSFMKYHIWLILITFKLKLGKIYKNSFLFAFVNLKRNIAVGVVSLLLYAATFALLLIPYNIALIAAVFIATCILPGFINLFTQFCVFEKVKKLMIDPYYEEHPGEDVDLRRGLGLEIEEEDENVFDDDIPTQNEK